MTHKLPSQTPCNRMIHVAFYNTRSGRKSRRPQDGSLSLSPNFSPSGERLWTGTPKNDLQNQPPGSKFSSIQMESGYGNRKTNIEGRNRDRQL